jgi:thiamine-monophosphate kinase
VSGPAVTVTVTLLGKPQMRDGVPLLMRRDGARAGDVIAVSGTLGRSAAGLRALREGAAAQELLPASHLRPRPPLQVAQAAARLGVVCAIDVSDGLVQDVGHVCESSRLGAVLLAADIPVDPEVQRSYPSEALLLACSGGEDYETVFVGAPGVISALLELHPGAVTTIGRMSDRRPGTVTVLDRTGAEVPLPSPGWDHLTVRGKT